MTANPGLADNALDLSRIREDFPALNCEVNGHPLVYLDNAATTQKPVAVLDRLERYYRTENANVHRGVHALSQTATDAYEGVRTAVAGFLGAPDPSQIVFTKGTTDAINLVANGFARAVLKPGDEILLTGMEHHSNIVPWQLAAEASGAEIKVVPINDSGEMDYASYERLLGERTKIVSVVHVSNTLGTINPVERIVSDAHAVGAAVLIDGAQAAPHLPIDVLRIGADFYCFSAHKVYGPTGAGALYATREWLDRLPPYQGGGDMIESVSFERTTFNEPPHKFEAGTPNIAGVIGMGTALEYLSSLDADALRAHEDRLLAYATEALLEIPDLRIVGTARRKTSVISFLIGALHPYDVGTVLDRYGIAVRTGHHCTQPLMTRYNIPGTIRASFALYSTIEEVDRLIEGVHAATRILS